MASLYDTVARGLAASEFGNVYDISRYQGGPPGGFDAEVRARLAAARAAAAAPPAVPTTPPAGLPAPTSPPPGTPPAVSPAAGGIRGLLGRAGGVARAALGPAATGLALATRSAEAGAGSDVVTDTTTGAPLTRPAGGPSADREFLASLATRDAVAQQETDARTRRVNEVIAASRALGNAPAPAAKPAPPTVDFSLGANYETLPQFYAQLAQNAAQTRAGSARAAAALEMFKVQAGAGKNQKVIPLENLEVGKSAVIGDTQVYLDSKGIARTRPVVSPVTAGQAQADARAELSKARPADRALRREQINERLAQMGYPPI